MYLIQNIHGLKGHIFSSNLTPTAAKCRPALTSCIPISVQTDSMLTGQVTDHVLTVLSVLCMDTIPVLLPSPVNHSLDQHSAQPRMALTIQQSENGGVSMVMGKYPPGHWLLQHCKFPPIPASSQNKRKT
ncbi:hypothetical protein GJAV_G00200580 [Gymnothorax javanicus]|nr:hypothetical protein GJAV_G00200580 [Gymnothorax javanicus]